MFSNIQHFLQKQLTSNFLSPWKFLPLILFIFFFYKYLHQTNLISRKKLPPSPPKLPIIGNLHQIGSHLHRSLRSLSERYGEVMMIQLGSWQTLVVSSARAAREIMVTHDLIFANRPITKKGEKFLYNYKDIVGSPYGEYWRQMKSICVLNLLSNKRVKSFESIRKEETAFLIQKIRDNSESKFPVNLTDLFIELTNSTICRVAFGRKYNGEENGIDFKKLLNELSKLSGEFNVGDVIPWLSWIDHLNGLDAKIDKVAKEFDCFLEKVVQEHQDHLDDKTKYEDGENDEKMKDIVDVLLDVQKDQTLRIPIDRDSIKAIIFDMFAAGTDTTSTLLEWIMTELLRHPKAMQELTNEVRKITEEKSEIKEDEFEQMKYMKAVIRESLRLHLPVPMLVFRQSTQDAKIQGYDIPAKTIVIINGFAIHRDANTWDEPEKFKPERFLNSKIDFRGQDFEFIPFGAGRRMCPGISFSMASIQLVLANLVQKFDWKLPGGVEAESLDINESVGLNVRRKTPLFAVATPCIIDANC